MSRHINMKLVFAAILTFAIFATIIKGSNLQDEELFDLFKTSLPSDANFVTVGHECSINSVAYPTKYLYMKHYRFFTTDHLKLKEGNPRSTEASDYDWRGLWTIQKYENSKSNKTEYRLKDHENNKYATFAPAELALIPKGGTKLVQGILWNLQVPTRKEGVITYIRNASPPNNAKKNFSLFLSVLPDDDIAQNGNRTVDMDININDSDMSKWKIICK